MKPLIGILQGRLTPSSGRGIQFFPKDNWEQEFSDAREIGLGAIELLMRPKGLREHPLMTEAGRTRLREIRDTTHIAIPSVHGYYVPEDGYAKDLFDIVHATADLGAKVILVSFFHEKKLGILPDATWKRAHELLAPAARHAAQLGITLGIEAELPAQTVLDFIMQSETPSAFGSYYDLGNQFACGFPVVDEIRLLNTKIAGVHIKDRLLNTDPNEESTSVPFGEGCADLPAALNALRDIGYRRPLILQGARKEDGGELALNAQYKKYIEECL
ncbi:MAG: sugar phosphate isomerase/epimerase family protein [bacterium]|nr:sugar phosphate isomerase/epimerase family protein [bacterium]